MGSIVRVLWVVQLVVIVGTMVTVFFVILFVYATARDVRVLHECILSDACVFYVLWNRYHVNI